MKLMKRATWLVVISGSALLIASSLPYLLPGIRYPFLLERMPLSLDALWLVTSKAHVACGLVCLPAGLVFLARRARERWPRLHRVLGRGYASIILFMMVPAGVYLAPYSKYGWALGSGFVLSAVILVMMTLYSIRAARRGGERRHRAAALHSLKNLPPPLLMEGCQIKL